MYAGDCEREVCHPLANALGKLVTSTGQAETSGASLEQRSPELQLQGLDPLTYSALGYAQLVRCLCEAETSGCYLECTQ